MLWFGNGICRRKQLVSIAAISLHTHNPRCSRRRRVQQSGRGRREESRASIRKAELAKLPRVRTRPISFGCPRRFGLNATKRWNRKELQLHSPTELTRMLLINHPEQANLLPLRSLPTISPKPNDIHSVTLESNTLLFYLPKPPHTVPIPPRSKGCKEMSNSSVISKIVVSKLLRCLLAIFAHWAGVRNNCCFACGKRDQARICVDMHVPDLLQIKCP